MPEDLVNYSSPPIKPRRQEKKTGKKQQESVQNWQVGDRVFHQTFGEGTVTHVLGSGQKTNLAVQFSGLGRKIIDPKIASLELI